MRLTTQQALTLVLAQAPGDPGGQGEDFGKSSPVGLLLLILFGIAVAFLIRSMSKHLKTLPTTFDEQKAEAAAPRRARRAAQVELAEDDAADAPDSGEQAGDGEDPTSKSS